MLLRSLTKHVKDQNWFAVALDFFIVVAGILIAFQITNWSEGRQTRADLAEAEIAIKTDLFINYINAKERLAFRDCRTARLGELAERLLEPDGPWQGMPFNVIGIDGVLSVDRVLRSPSRGWGSRIWEAELARGTFNKMSAERRRVLDKIFTDSNYAEITQEKILDGQARLKILANTIDLSKSDRMRYYDIVAEIDENSYWLEVSGDQIAEAIENYGVVFDSDESKKIRSLFSNRIDETIHRLAYGECFKPIIIPFLKDADAETSP